MEKEVKPHIIKYKDNLNPANRKWEGMWEKYIEIYNRRKAEIKKEIANGGVIKEEIEHGDYGYMEVNGIKYPKMFLRTEHDKIEAFCNLHVGEYSGKCTMGAEVNKNPKAFRVCGNLWDVVMTESIETNEDL